VRDAVEHAHLDKFNPPGAIKYASDPRHAKMKSQLFAPVRFAL